MLALWSSQPNDKLIEKNQENWNKMVSVQIHMEKKWGFKED